MSKAIDDVLAERTRQIESEGMSAKHDDQHEDRSLVFAAVCYARQAAARDWLLEGFADSVSGYAAERPSRPPGWAAGG